MKIFLPSLKAHGCADSNDMSHAYDLLKIGRDMTDWKSKKGEKEFLPPMKTERKITRITFLMKNMIPIHGKLISPMLKARLAWKFGKRSPTLIKKIFCIFSLMHIYLIIWVKKSKLVITYCLNKYKGVGVLI